MLVVGILGKRKLYELHFFKLMLAYEAARILSIASGLAAKAWRISDVIYRQVFSVKDFLGVIIGDRHLGGRNQSKTSVVFDMKQVVLKFWKLVSSKKGRPIHQKWRQRLGVSVLGGVDLKHEIYESAAQTGTGSIE